MRDPDACLFTDELDGPTAGRVHDREAARHCFDDGGRARVVDLGVEQKMCSTENRRRVAL
jgi:hypothetical protein